MSDQGRFINYKDCAYFPCHNVENEETFNCKFCYCPLYTLGDACGGNMRWIDTGDTPIKDCSDCLVPHRADAADFIDARFADLSKLAAQNHR